MGIILNRGLLLFSIFFLLVLPSISQTKFGFECVDEYFDYPNSIFNTFGHCEPYWKYMGDPINSTANKFTPIVTCEDFDTIGYCHPDFEDDFMALLHFGWGTTQGTPAFLSMDSIINEPGTYEFEFFFTTLETEFAYSAYHHFGVNFNRIIDSIQGLSLPLIRFSFFPYEDTISVALWDYDLGEFATTLDRFYYDFDICTATKKTKYHVSINFSCSDEFNLSVNGIPLYSVDVLCLGNNTSLSFVNFSNDFFTLLSNVYFIPEDINIRYFDTIYHITNRNSFQDSFIFYDTIFGVCEDSLITHILLSPCLPLFPTAFSPNGDGYNDGFRGVYTANPSECPAEMNEALSIYDRWGNLVFSGTGPTAAWDGRMNGGDSAPIGVYVYVYKARIGEEEQLLKGNLTLLR